MKKQELTTCPYCSYKFYPKEDEDIEYINSIKMCFCKNCGEEFPLTDCDFKINNYTKYNKKEWN